MIINKQKIIKYNEIRQKIASVSYPMKDKYNIVIPPYIFQTWHSKTLPPLMYKATCKLRKLNPRFNYFLYDDNDCREFIKNNYNSDVLNAFDTLIPGAYKADLWRYCILYKYGGIYLDIKYVPTNGFKLINLLEKEHFCLDADCNRNIYNAILVCKSGNEILLNAINKIVEKVNNKSYEGGCLDVTGPGLLAQVCPETKRTEMIDLKHGFYVNMNNRYITYNGYHILNSYNGYIAESSAFQCVDHYSVLWEKRKIYK